jgi:gluconate kinase
LHPKFDIQGVHKVVNLTTKDQTMWLANVQVQLISNIEETQRWYKENVDEHWKE